jgi:hypothetical protein
MKGSLENSHEVKDKLIVNTLSLQFIIELRSSLMLVRPMAKLCLKISYFCDSLVYLNVLAVIRHYVFLKDILFFSTKKI